ncbi:MULTISPECIES: subunit I/II of b(o/a)3-type cytochrome C oxidase [Bacillaceae]|uniref:Subunit I/II of b(O/a)3-type cytochrome C oxidase n=1 Tax=Pseudobacillus wudalianchiensis TaxID=1743143 RepID=A0A1B9B821_9BACI|nr:MULTISPECIES: subunit I/II of b(o/a)3-type cytochrome C oxidase [Bacillus]OCA92254.1 subunit I/II of b(o/a)3-type cytochrome C oxidase [Bacillus wudalianchiensis]
MEKDKEKTYKKDSLKGTLFSVLAVGGFILLSWFTVWSLFLSRI